MKDVEEAGGVYTDFFGDPIDCSEVLLRPQDNFTSHNFTQKECEDKNSQWRFDKSYIIRYNLTYTHIISHS